jgi:tRNA/rRNA methyltransferase
MSLSNVKVVLVEPLYGGNVGSVCRAMMNMGLSRLVVVGGTARLDMDEARTFAYRAAGLLETMETAGTLAEAVADCGLVAGTTARVGLYRDHSRTPREWAPTLLQAAAQGPVAMVFGREDKGLTNDELALCTQFVQIPSTDSYTSLNLAQAVMVCCYELYLAEGSFQPSQEKFPEATSEQRERMFGLWQKALLDIGFMEDDKSTHMMLGLRRILSRGSLTDADVRILMGIARQTQWCADQARRLREPRGGLDSGGA